MSNTTTSQKEKVESKMNAHFMCHKCFQISHAELWEISDNGKLTCPNCLTLGLNMQWPEYEAQELFTSIKNLKGELLEYDKIASVLFVAAFRQLLEDLVRNIALDELLYEEGGHLVDILISTNSKPNQLLKVLEELSSDCHDDLVDEEWNEGFYRTYKGFAQINNKLLYGEISLLPELPPDFIELNIPPVLDLFSRLNNEYHPRIQFKTKWYEKEDED